MTALLDTSTVIVGASGSGKTVTAKADVEQLLAERRHLAVIDPTGVWWGLRSNATGDGPGFDIPIFGGEHADVPIRPTDGAAIARIVVEQRVSAIVDISGMDTSREWREFMHDFVAALRRKPRGNFHFIVDEADEIAPQTAPDDIGFALRENMVWMAKRGRVHGFVPTFITQRTAEIANAVISQAQTLIVHQLILPADQAVIAKYLKGHAEPAIGKQVMASLAELQVGERWIYSPRLKVLERGVTPPIATFDSSRTPAPGEHLVEPRTLAQLDVSAIRAAMSNSAVADGVGEPIVGDVAAWRRDELAAKRRIFDLEAEVTRLRHDRETLEFVAKRSLEIGSRINTDMATLLHLFDDERRPTPRRHDMNMHPHDANLHDETTEAPSGRAAPTVEGVSAPAADLGFPSPADTPAPATPDRENRALVGLATIFPAGLTEAAWAARTGYAHKGGAWIRRRKRYVDDNLIEHRDGRWFATSAGVDRAGTEIPDMPPPGLGLVEWWAGRVSASAARRALHLLAGVHPRALTRDAIAAEIHMAPKGGAFLRAIGELKAAALITEAKKRLAIAGELMGEG